MRTIGLAILALLLGRASLAADSAESSLQSLLGAENAGRLLARGELRSEFSRDERLSLLPDVPERHRVVEEVAALEPTVGVEYLLLYAPPTSAGEDPAFVRKMYNTLRAFSTLAGIEYFSTSRGKRHTYFREAYVIDSPEDRNRMDDPRFIEIPEHSQAYGYLDESSVGRYIARVDYTHDHTGITMSITNVTSIRYLLVPVVSPGEIRTFIALLPAGDAILFYGLAGVKTTNLFNPAEKRTASFYNRLEALYDWFRTNLEDS